jgi:hypothetical protein
VHLKCVQEGGRLRVRITTKGYSASANCQFPRDLRVEGRAFSVPAGDVSMASTKGKFFYRVKKSNIRVLNAQNANDQEVHIDLKNLKIYGEKDATECNVCMCDPVELCILVPCGHNLMCMPCAQKCKTCPMCRQDIAQRITRDQLQ